MIQPTNKFAFARKSIRISDTVSIEKYDVGIIESETEKDVSIFFVRIGQRIMLNKNDFKVFDPIKTGDGFSRKICNICHKLLNTTEFAKNQNAKNNRSVRRPSCRECRKQLEGVDIGLKEKRKWSKNKPQNRLFKCPICAKITIAGITSKVVLDHDHRTGKARDWICDSCNTGLGRFKDDIGLLKRAIKFLEQDS